MSAAKPTIIFTAPKITSGFMEQDITLMSPYVNVLRLDLSDCSGFQRACYYTRLWHMLTREGSALVFAYFVLAKYTPLLALMVKALRRKLIIVTGGIDATWVPDIRWGDMGSPLRRTLFAFVMRLSDSVLPFSNAAREDVLRYGHPPRIRTAYLSADTDLFKPQQAPRARRAVTACYAISHAARQQKGVEPFVRAAALLPDVEFTVVGEFVDDSRGYLKSIATPNVTFTERRFNAAECAALFASSSAYVQASAHEGFGVSLAEGMASGCVPVVADRYAMPEVVGGTGYVVPFNDPAALAQAVRDALSHPEKGLAARQRVLDNFTPAHRQRLLREELELALGRSLA